MPIVLLSCEYLTGSLQAEWVCAIVYLVYSVVVYLHFGFGVLNELCAHLGTGLFTLPKQPPAEAAANGAGNGTTTNGKSH